MASISCSRRSGEVSITTRVMPCAPRALDQQRAAAAAVFRIVGIAGAPAERRTRHAGGGAAAEDRQRQRHAAAFGARHLGEQPEEVFRGLPRDLLQRDAARLRQHLCDFDHIGRLVALAAKFAGREIRRVGLDHDAVGRQLGGERAQGFATS